MATLNVSADVQFTFSAPAALDVLNRKVVDAPVAMAPFTGAAIIDIQRQYDLAADVELGAFTAAALLEVNATTGLVANVSMARFRTNATEPPTYLQLIYSGDLTEYTQLIDSDLRGAWKGAVGPGATVALAGQESRRVVFVQYNDLRGLKVAGSFPVPSRPTAIASTKKFPDITYTLNDDDELLFVLLEGRQDSSAERFATLQCYALTFEGTLLNEVTLPRGTNPRVLWGANDDTEATFLILAGDHDGVSLRRATVDMEHIASQATGIYRPEVADVQIRPDLAQTHSGITEKVWHILVFSETGAEGQLLEYREQEWTVSPVGGGDPIVTSKSTLRMVEVFAAPHVEGPIRLFNQQDMLIPPTLPVIVAAGFIDLGGPFPPDPEGVASRSFNGVEWSSTELPDAAGISAAGSFGFTGILGTLTGDIYTAADKLQSIWVHQGVHGGGYTISNFGVHFEGGRVFAAIEGGDALIYSEDRGVTWQTPVVGPPPGTDMLDVDYANGTWVACGFDSNLWYSEDGGDTWVESTHVGWSVNTRFHGQSYNAAVGRWIVHSIDDTRVFYSDDGGRSFYIGGQLPRDNLRNSAWAPIGDPRYGTWVLNADETGGAYYYYSLDGGESWIEGDQFVSWNPNDMIWADNISPPQFIMAASVQWDGGGDGGGIARSFDGITWEVVYSKFDDGFRMVAALTPAVIPRTFKWRLAVSRYDQIQEWLDSAINGDTRNNAGLVYQGDISERYREYYLSNADRDWQRDNPDAPNIAHTYRANPSNPMCPAPWHQPRTKSWRIEGGYLEVHGATARVARRYCYPDELNSVLVERLPFRRMSADVTLSPFTSAAVLEVLP